jgi:hypothetical protein
LEFFGRVKKGSFVYSECGLCLTPEKGQAARCQEPCEISSAKLPCALRSYSIIRYFSGFSHMKQENIAIQYPLQ